MNKKILFISLVLFSNLLYSQNAIYLNDTSAQWSVMHCCNPTTTRHYVFVGDTAIDTLVYRKLFFTYEPNFILSNATYIGAMRKDSSKIFYYDITGEEYLLYDFSILIGDTINVKHISLVLDSIDYIQIKGINRKRMYLHDIDPGARPQQQWIEGIGSTFGLIEVTATQAGDITTDLLCFHIQDSLVYENGFGLCHYSNVGIIKLESEEIEIKIYPNPFIENTKIFFAKNQLDTYSIKLYDLTGKISYEKDNIKKNEFILRKGKLKSGLYILQICKSEKLIKSYKIIIK